MKNLLSIVTFAFVLVLSGCAQKSASAAQDNAAEHEKFTSTYYYGALISVDDAKKKLTDNGFEIVTTYKVDKKGNLTSIVFTNAELKAAADKPGRGYASILRMLVDKEHNRISITNPKYFLNAFMQKEYNPEFAESLSAKIHKAFGALQKSPDQLETDDLAGYHFMVGMPYYEDFDIVGEGTNAELIQKAKDYKKGKELVFEMKIGEGRTLLGYKLSRRSSKFPITVGSQNAQVLPYTILIEDNKATTLAPKYYIAISYPLLSMGEFMDIASVPGAINKELSKPFK